MSEVVKEPSDAEFSALLNERAPNRLKDPETWEPEVVTPPVEAPVPVAPEDGLVPEPEVVAPVAPVVPDKYAGKTTEEVARMHSELELKLGEQGRELGELRGLRSELDQLKGALAEREAYTPQAPLTQETVDWVEESVMGNGRSTMEWVEKNQPALKERTLQAWASVDPYAAAAYNTEKLLAAQEEKFASELAAVRAPVLAQQTNTQLETAYGTVSTNLPGFDEVAEDLPALLEANPELKAVLVNGDLAAKTRILDNLGKMALANRALAPPASAPVVEATVPVIDPRVAASVSTGSSSGEHGGEAVSETDRLKSRLLTSGPTSIQDELARSRAKAR